MGIGIGDWESGFGFGELGFEIGIEDVYWGAGIRIRDWNRD